MFYKVILSCALVAHTGLFGMNFFDQLEEGFRRLSRSSLHQNIVTLQAQPGNERELLGALKELQETYTTEEPLYHQLQSRIDNIRLVLIKRNIFQLRHEERLLEDRLALTPAQSIIDIRRDCATQTDESHGLIALATTACEEEDNGFVVLDPK